MAPKALVAGNWKMNGLKAGISELSALIDAVSADSANCDVLICPPMTLLAMFSEQAQNSSVQIGAQDCHTNVSGAHTGDISAAMIKDVGGTYAIVGHSERRQDHGETNELVCRKAQAAHSANLVAIVCVGETEDERDAGQTLDVVLSQVKESLPDASTPETTIIAYEPVWAIGTGKTPTAQDVEDVHTAIRGALVERFGESAGNMFRILYGGSVKPANAAELMTVANVNGALVGGASLKATDFNGIIDAYRAC